MRWAAALALCTVGCQFPPAAIPGDRPDGGEPGDADGAINPPDAAVPDAEIPDAMPDAFTCPKGFVQAELGCYSLETADLTWQQAEASCEGRGGHLVIIDNLQEDITVSNLANANGLQYPWIGLTDHAIEGVFLWVDDSPPAYTNWNAGEPNNAGAWGADENCGELLPEATWNDSGCDNTGDSICEHDGRPVGAIFW